MRALQKRRIQGGRKILTAPVLVSTGGTKFSDNAVDDLLQNSQVKKADIGLIGLATMGKNLARNIAGKGFSVIVYNRTAEKTQEFIKEFGTKNLTGAKNLREFIKSLAKPHKIILLVKAGQAVDEVIKELCPLLEKNDLIIDLGNSNPDDTMRREKELSAKKIDFIGCGISGGEEGALHGPSLMPGGKFTAYKKAEKVLKAIAANDGTGGKCITHIGQNPAGHFVKMVHNGIEYGLMQAIAESYDLLKKLGEYDNKKLAATFTNWNKSATLNSFLLEITSKIMARKDNLIDFIKDTAEQKGTGKWAVEAAYNLGVPLPSISAAVEARILSGDNIRKKGKDLPKVFNKIPVPKNLEEIVRNSLECSFVCILNQGLTLVRRAGEAHNWNLDMSEIIRIWRGGCIIRSQQLEKWQRAYGEKPAAQKASKEIIKIFEGNRQKNWRLAVSFAANHGIPTPVISSSLAYYDSIIASRLPQNLIQAQRDFFGAHGYQRTDKKGIFHSNWN